VNFVLVHGSYAGPWVWELLQPHLERLGHRATAVDLPISDPAAGAEAYARAIADAIDPNEPPILVAHSMSGLAAPIAAAERLVRRVVFVAALLPRPGVSLAEQRAAEPVDASTQPTTAQWTDLGGDLWAVGPDTATELFWHDAPPEIARWAASRLRPQCYRFMTEPSPLTAWPAVPTAYVACRDDHATNPAWQVEAARDRLGVEALVLPGGHSPMLSRPAALAHALDELARTA
jgi:hypothetical protein